ncbi:MAG: P1 family peptidase [Oscillospiraceae bacterium]|jgi:L-aminopeptidase/D-esterase-like protein|nr:P1 family peptidase [Oscillospiraceae bacterium]
MTLREIDIAQVADFRIGSAEDAKAKTGCTVVLAPQGAVCGVDIRGGSPVTADTAALDPVMHRQRVHACLLSGGSSFGLAASDGVRQYLEARGIGRDVGVTRVPNVVSAVLFDLKVGRADVRPDAAMGVAACEAAFGDMPFRAGNFGAGCGATLGKARGMAHAMQGGQAAAAFEYGDLRVGALVAVNCVGDIVRDGAILAGTLGDEGFADSEQILLAQYAQSRDFFSDVEAGNTVLACVLTNARLTKAQCTKIAGHGQNGIARAIRPAHSEFDGDTVFALASGAVPASMDAVGLLAARAVEAAIWQLTMNN